MSAIKASIKFIGATASGKGFKYEVVGADQAKVDASVKALEGAGVEMNGNLGVPGFISSTHLHLTPEIGKTAEVEVMGKDIQGNGRIVNYFPNIDKTKQKAFVESVVLQQEIGGFVAVENALTNLKSGMDIEKYMKVRLLKSQEAMYNKKIALMSAPDEL